MRAAIILCAALVLSGCGTRPVKPAEVEIDRVEAALAKQSCVGELSGWQRQYYYHPKYFGEEVEQAKKEGRVPRSSRHIRTLIGFDLRQGGANAAGRISLESPPMDGAEAAQSGERRALGSYDIRTGAVELVRCDPKMG